jgi:hypothetical protein
MQAIRGVFAISGRRFEFSHLSNLALRRGTVPAQEDGTWKKGVVFILAGLGS